MKSLSPVLLAVLIASGCASSVRMLPPWNPAWSDGCSLVPDINPRVRQCCQVHDEAYYYGGSLADRVRADGSFYVCLLVCSDPVIAAVYYAGVTAGGGPQWQRPGVSWSFGGCHFQYARKPALPATFNGDDDEKAIRCSALLPYFMQQ